MHPFPAPRSVRFGGAPGYSTVAPRPRGYMPSGRLGPPQISRQTIGSIREKLEGRRNTPEECSEGDRP